MKRPLRIGIFGGTFDPIHNGHLQAAGEILDRFRLDRIIFIPSRIPPHKRRHDMAPANIRLAMVESAVQGRRGFEASGLEVRALRTSYSIMTLGKIRKIFPGASLFFIVGADAFLEIKTWREWRRVLDQCVFIVMTRPGSSLMAARAVLGFEFRERTAVVRKASDVDRLIRKGRTVLFCPIDARAVSSTDIRRRVRGGRSIAGLVTAGVAARIASGHLYQGRET